MFETELCHSQWCEREEGAGRKAQRGGAGDCRNVLEAGWCFPQTADAELAREAASKFWHGVPIADWSPEQRMLQGSYFAVCVLLC